MAKYKIIKMITAINRTVMVNKQNKHIVIHYTGNRTDTAKANATYFKVYRGASAHYFVDKTSIYQVVEDKDSAWAVGVNYGTNNMFNQVKNSNSISIEMCSNDGKIAEETYKNTVALTKDLMKKYNIPAKNVVRHYDVCSKNCPGWKGWIGSDTSIWDRFKKDIANESTSTTTPSKPKKKDTKPTVAKPTVNNGSTGTDSKNLQKDLNYLGFKGKNGKKLTEDGIFGQNSVYALKLFQKKYKLDADGIYGQASYKKMSSLLK